VSNSNFDNLERAIVLRGGAGLWEHRNAPDETVLSTTDTHRRAGDARAESAAAGSLLEGIEEILTVTRLGLPKELRRSLACM
jgi:putative transposase